MLFIALQLGLDVILLFVIGFLWRERRRTLGLSATTPNPSPELLQLADEVRAETERNRQRAQDLLRDLVRITEEANRLLKKAQVPTSQFAPSLEECELKAALSVDTQDGGHDRTAAPAPPAVERIPTLQQLEKTRQRLKSDMTPDLRTLLKDQLA